MNAQQLEQVPQCKQRSVTYLLLTYIMSGYGNDYLPWLYTQTLQQQKKGGGEGANVCIVLGK